MADEERLLELFKYHPYLIDDELENFELIFRRYPNGTQPDLLFYKPNPPCEIVIVEIKSGAIDHNAVNQIYSYIRKERDYDDCDNIRGIIIGRSISDNAVKLLQQISENKNINISVKILGRDVPEKVKFCIKCRRANWLNVQECKYCGNKKFFT